MSSPSALNPSTTISFIIKNNSSINRAIKVFNTKIGPGNRLDLMKIPGVTEEDIRSEVLRGSLRPLLAGRSLIVISSTVNFQTQNAVHGAFLASIGISGADLVNTLALTQSVWYIDPITGDDSNAGTTASIPLKTFTEIVRRWGTTTPYLPQDTFIFFLNDQQDFNDPINISPTMNATNLHIIGAPKLLATDTIATFTALNRTSGTDGYFTGTTIADFTQYAGMLMRVKLTTLATRGTGTTPPAATFSGTPLVDCEPIQVNITKGGTLGVATFSWFLNGVLQETGILTASVIALGLTGISINFPSGTYNTTNIYTGSSAAYTWIDTANGNLDPGNLIGATATISQTFATGKQYGFGGLQWAGILARTYGTTPPAATFTGIPQAHYNNIKVEITTGGTVGTALFKYSINGVVQQTGITTASAVILGTTGVVINFVSGTYNTDNVYVGASSPSYAGPDWGQPPNIQTIASGLIYEIYQPTKVYALLLATAVAGNSAQIQSAAGNIKLQDIWFVCPNTPPYGFPAPEVIVGQNSEFAHCRIDGNYYHTPQRFHGAVNNYFSGGLAATDLWIYGGVIGAGGPFLCAAGNGVGDVGLTIDGDVIIHFSPGVYILALIIGSAHVKGGTITCRSLGDCYLTPNGRGIFYSASAPGGATALWGSARLVLKDGRSFRFVNTSGVTATNSLLLTGTPTVTIDGLSAAGFPLSTYASGTWSAGPATTPLATIVAALDAGAPVSGDTFSIQNPNTGTMIIMNGNNNTP